MKLTRDQIRNFAQNAGFAGEDLATAVAIAQAESSGDTAEYNPETAFFAEHNVPLSMGDAASALSGRGSCGLWQIFRFEHPEFNDWNLADPQVNACAAYLVYAKRAKSFWPWSSWTSGRYKQYLEVAS